MKRYLLILALLSQAPQVGLAQVESEDIDFSLPSSTEQVMDGPDVEIEAIEVDGTSASGPAANGGQSITIMNTPTASAQNQSSMVQKQPTTVIEASPLGESRAEKMRRARQEVELGTELKIVESLEKSRMEDEKRRADALFGDKFNQLNNQQNAQAVPVVTEPPVQYVEPKEDVNIREEIRAAMTDLEAEKNANLVQDKKYMSAMVGIGEYPNAVNVRGNMAAGFSLGMKQERLMMEGSFLYANFDVEQVPTCGYGPCNAPAPMNAYPSYYPEITSMDQYSGAFAVKYQVLNGKLRPVVGGIAAYTYRSFTNSQFYSPNSSTSSQAMDMGLVLGADLELSERFALGLDFRYMFNIWNRVNSDFQRSFVQPALQTGTPIEEMRYYVLGISGRMSF